MILVKNGRFLRETILNYYCNFEIAILHDMMAIKNYGKENLLILWRIDFLPVIP